MKKIFGLIIAASTLVGFTACSDFLDEDNKTGMTADLTYNTETGIEGLVKSCYAYTRGWWGKEAGLGLTEMGSDLFLAGFDNECSGGRHLHWKCDRPRRKFHHPESSRECNFENQLCRLQRAETPGSW